MMDLHLCNHTNFCQQCERKSKILKCNSSSIRCNHFEPHCHEKFGQVVLKKKKLRQGIFNQLNRTWFDKVNQNVSR